MSDLPMGLNLGPLAGLRSRGPVEVPPNTWTPLPWHETAVDTHRGFDRSDPSGWRMPQPGYYECMLGIEYAYRESFVLSFAVLLDGIAHMELGQLARGHGDDGLNDGTETPPLIHAAWSPSALVLGHVGERLEFAVRQSGRGPLTLTGAHGGPVEASVIYVGGVL